MPSRNFELLREAIELRMPVYAIYGGHHRWFCPHALGYKGGVERVLAYQYDGTSAKGLGPAGSPANWRCMNVKGLRQLTLVVGRWHPGPRSIRPQKCVGRVEAEVID
jgi:hypothetical protein